jgi:hypothetical protein
MLLDGINHVAWISKDVGRLLRHKQLEHDLLGENPEIFDARAEVPGGGPSGTQLRKPILVPASLAKGLEFDHVVLLEPAENEGTD